MNIKLRVEKLEEEFGPKKGILPPLFFTTMKAPQEIWDIVKDIRQKIRRIEKDSGWKKDIKDNITNVGTEFGEYHIKELESNLERLRETLEGVIEECRFTEIEDDIKELRRKLNFLEGHATH